MQTFIFALHLNSDCYLAAVDYAPTKQWDYARVVVCGSSHGQASSKLSCGNSHAAVCRGMEAAFTQNLKCYGNYNQSLAKKLAVLQLCLWYCMTIYRIVAPHHDNTHPYYCIVYSGLDTIYAIGSAPSSIAIKWVNVSWGGVIWWFGG